jgi:hypothetical protein
MRFYDKIYCQFATFSEAHFTAGLYASPAPDRRAFSHVKKNLVRESKIVFLIFIIIII